MRYDTFIARKSEIGVAESRFGQYSPMEWLRIPRT